MSIWWSLHLRREAASVPLARRFLLGTMESAGVDPDISFDLSLALSEACANAVEHGGAHGDAGDVLNDWDAWDAWEEPSGTACGQYRVTAYLDGEKCRIEVADSGPGFPARRVLRTAAQPDEAVPLPGSKQPHGPQYAEYPPLTAEDGRGLCLIEQLADHVHFGNRPGQGGAVVSFDKVLKWREGALLMAS
ncbi:MULTISPECIES: ATP-binding protein [unclassified Streptomyces]|uniref:ATP-binding protein n=1 Tax=unclassified Streptomyces TaxID=2593676 RepID=UPI002259F77E|nr:MULTISPECIES: ATP-binding protein [unclassified Streptomyces]MCX5141545.1 ATP-binding protein [Streptomyces sp. NBC_00338]WRZ66046.1 ATP-binding protein [Streptomyces sp. NBC_01257]WSU60056.1 ATP-binding protein [Streptomyces sp. NBC_01104]